MMARAQPSSPQPSSPQASSRQAALLLHAMCEQDRDWVLQALPEGQRSVLLDLLAELRELGIPAQPGLLSQAVAHGVSTQPKPAASSSAHAAEPALGAITDSLKNLAPPQVESLAKLLRGEPALLVAQLLRMQAWPWQAAVLGQLASVQRRNVQEALHGFGVDAGVQAAPAALQAVVLRGIHQRLARLHGTLPAPAGEHAATRQPKGLAQWAQRFRHMLPARFARRGAHS